MKNILNKVKDSIIKNPKIAIIPSIITIALITGIITTVNINKTPAAVLKEEVKEISYKNVIKESLTLEIGKELPNIEEYFEKVDNLDKAKISYYINNEEQKLESFCNTKDNKYYPKELKEYDVKVTANKNTYETKLIVKDTTVPVVKTKNQTITTGDKYDIKNFIASYQDNSGDANYNIAYENNAQAAITQEGTHDIKIKVCDKSNNCVSVAAKLVVNKKAEVKKETTTKKDTTKQEQKKTTTPKQTTPKQTTPKTDSTPTVKPTKKTTEKKVLNTVTSKYGTKIETYQILTYQNYSDGTKKLIKTGSKITAPLASSFLNVVKTMKSDATSTYNSNSSSINKILTITNGYREAEGVGNLTVNRDLSIMATIRAMEIAYSDKFSHTRPSGKSWDTMWDDYGRSKSGTIGENLGMGFSSDEGVCNGWKNSSGHYANMIKGVYTKIGIGKFKLDGTTYWVQLFQS